MRDSFNKKIFEQTIDLLRSDNDEDVFIATVWSAYLIEQSLKYKIRAQNPLLYFKAGKTKDLLDASCENLTPKQKISMKTIGANDCFELICEMDDSMTSNKDLFKELFSYRNYIMHSTDELPLSSHIDKISAAHASFRLLQACRSYLSAFIDDSELLKSLTSSTYENALEILKKGRIEALQKRIEERKSYFNSLSSDCVDKLLRLDLNESDKWSYTVVQGTETCPACNQDALNLLETGGIDEDGIGGSSQGFHCAVCELELDGYEYGLLQEMM